MLTTTPELACLSFLSHATAVSRPCAAFIQFSLARACYMRLCSSHSSSKHAPASASQHSSHVQRSCIHLCAFHRHKISINRCAIHSSDEGSLQTIYSLGSWHLESPLSMCMWLLDHVCRRGLTFVHARRPWRKCCKPGIETIRTSPLGCENASLACVACKPGRAVTFITTTNATVGAVVGTWLHGAVHSDPWRNTFACAIDTVSSVIAVVGAAAQVACVTHPSGVAHACAPIAYSVS